MARTIQEEEEEKKGKKQHGPLVNTVQAFEFSLFRSLMIRVRLSISKIGNSYQHALGSSFTSDCESGLLRCASLRTNVELEIAVKLHLLKPSRNFSHVVAMYVRRKFLQFDISPPRVA